MKLKDGFIIREIAGEYIAFPVGEAMEQFQGNMVLNEVSTFILNHMSEPVSKETLLDLLVSEYDVTRQEASEDLDSLLQVLTDYGMIEAE